MKILVKERCICGYATDIQLGIYDESFEKWALYDENGNLMYYMIDDNFELIENVTFPEDYADGKYLFEDGEFVLNEDWKPYVPTEERILELEGTVEILQEENIASSEIEAELLYELSLLQLGFTE